METRRVLLGTGTLLACTNILVSFIATLYFGGVPNAALFSSAPDRGPYFLNSNGHLTEVSQHVYTTLVWQGRSTVLTSLLGILCFLLLRRRGTRSH